jgi:hypothetical protein
MSNMWLTAGRAFCVGFRRSLKAQVRALVRNEPVLGTTRWQLRVEQDRIDAVAALVRQHAAEGATAVPIVQLIEALS